MDLPEALIDAHRAGRLVIFVGAGASRDAPSSLPDFPSLTAGIASDAQVEVTAAELHQPDVLLGRLHDRQVDVHRLVAARIGVPSSRPNRLHMALASVSAAGPLVRMVTTNYDEHLSTVLAEAGTPVVEYAGPALPLGDDFEGLVYLHGRLSQGARWLVVTDRDFGRAYLRDAWAARFLERMYATFTVLFVGYSHGDVVMRYLARGLGPGAPRYVLTPTPDAPDWPTLGLHPVGYPIANDSHGALAEVLEGWASLASMGLLDHRQRLAQLVAAPPSQVPEEVSYLERLVAEPQTVQLFVALARGEDWLRWAALQPEFRRLFDRAAVPSDCAASLAYWFAEHFVMVEELTGAALEVVADAGGQLGATVWSAIGHHLHIRGAPRPEWLGPWLVLLIENDPGSRQDWLEYALVASRWPQDRAESLLLFDHLTGPRPVPQRSFGLDGPPRFDIEIHGAVHWLQEAWESLFRPNLGEAAADILATADRHLRHAHRLLVASNSAGPGWDPLSFRRSAIEPHTQDRYHRSMDVLIDAARDSLESLLDVDSDLGPAYVRAWAESDVPILRRLAVHGWSHRTDVDPTAKIAWLRGQGWLFNHQLRHEVFRLIEVTLKDTADDVADALVADVVAGPPDGVDEEHRSYERFNALAWMVRNAPALRTAREALQQVQTDHPDFTERPHPDLESWSEVGFVVPRPPMSATDLHQRIGSDVTAAISDLRQYEGATFPFDRPTWGDALAVLTDVAREHPTDGLAVLDATGGDHPDVVRAVIHGWATATVDAETAKAILDRLARVDLSAVAEDLSRMLSDGGQGEASPTEWHRFPESRHLATRLWVTLGAAGPATDVDDWLHRAINSPAGRLALFWVHTVAADWRAAGDDWAGLPADIRDVLEMMLAGHDDSTELAEVVFASHLLLFFGADRAWCESHVLPLLAWGNPARAQRAWDGYLVWGRWNDQLLAAGLLDGYMDAARNIGDLRGEPRRQLCSHLADVAVSSELEPIQWMRTFTSLVEVPDRVEWMSQVAWRLGLLPTDAVERQWHRWMERYWQDRLDSVPLSLTQQEASAMATWVVELTDSIGRGVALATAQPAALREHTNLLHDLADDRLERAPASFAKLIAHLLRGTQPEFWGGHYLAQIGPRLRDKADTADVLAIVEEATRLGCADAATW